MSDRYPNHFAAYLDFLIASRFSRPRDLFKALGEPYTHKKSEAIRQWRKGRTRPRIAQYVGIAKKIEKIFELDQGRLTNLIGGSRSALFDHVRPKPHDMNMLRWHLPDDFDDRSEQRKRDILEWVSANVLSCATAYGKYSPTEAARMLGISRTLLYELIARGQIKSILIGARRLITRRAIEQFLSEREALP